MAPALPECWHFTAGAAAATIFARSLAGFDALAVDLPGFGASPPPAEVMGAEGYAALVLRFSTFSTGHR